MPQPRTPNPEHLYSALAVPLWESLGDALKVGPYWVQSLDSLQALMRYLLVADDEQMLAPLFADTLYRDRRYFGLVEQPSMAPFAIVAVIDRGDGYVPLYGEAIVYAPVDGEEFWPVTDAIASLLSRQDYATDYLREITDSRVAYLEFLKAG